MTVLPSNPPEFLRLPREMVLASAGTGKTFTLSSRMMGLLAAGMPPDTILATTFTRKAAGEILARVLTRLARITLGEPGEVELAFNALFDPGGGQDPSAVRETFSRCLAELVRELHRVNVGTLDSFFIRIAGSFPAELGMPPEWGICDEAVAQGLEADALQTVLAAANRDGMAELVRMTMKGESGRGVHSRVLAQLAEVRDLIHQRGIRDPRALWEPPAPLEAPEPEGSNDWASIAERLRKAPVPLTKAGKPHSAFTRAVEEGIHALEAEEWEGFCLKGLGKVILEGKPTFHRKEMDPALQLAVRGALAGVAKAMAPQIRRQSQALQSLVGAYDDALTRAQRRQGAYRFKDITFLLGGMDPLTTRSDLWYRLDQRVRHLLLDEFQDTSRAQWEALDPLAAELLSGSPEERSVVVVADPKQSIYGWRGAEPDLVRRVGTRFGLDGQELTLSFRSSTTVLELVNRTFGDLPSNPVWEGQEDLSNAVRRWWEGFRMHEAAQELPGHVVLRAGPGEENAAPSRRPRMMSWAADWIREIHLKNPGRTLGVLVRRNATSARLVRDLRALGVDASEEGSSSLADSPAVSALLALLRLTDHPGDSMAAYQVAHSPLGRVVGLVDPVPSRERSDLALSLRRSLLTEGYGRLLYRWARELARKEALEKRDLDRVLQLVELGYRWDEKATLRPGDFVRFVRNEKMEAPSDSLVRVMTVHQAKGLEFDAVVLPELDDRMTRGQGRYKAVLPLRDPQTGQVLRVFPKLRKELRPLFPEMEEAGRQDREGELTDAIGVLYVALTRARHALYLCTAEDPPEGPVKLPFSHSTLLRHALGLAESPARQGEALFEKGDPGWGGKIPDPGVGKGEPASSVEAPGDALPASPPPSPVLHLRAAGERRRNLPRVAPSDHGDPASLGLGRILAIRGRAGRRVGAVVHRWLETMEWIEDWSPGTGELHRLATEVAAGISKDESDALADRLRGWLQAEEIREALARTSYPQGAGVRNELPFALRLGEGLVQGRMDRVILAEAEGRVTHAWILDFKTDAIPARDEEALAAGVREYEGQLRTYLRAACKLFSLPTRSVTGLLLFLAPGRTVGVGRPTEE